ncbi:hypothetical protein [Clostridium sp. VAP51]|uniref:hypothetical protein n=1 Tax=Clostridium sp. VAP51 TaxID=2949978 RepID=UPI00207A0638|nr:hypothetical protein [Clostridium sp. VAP51]
MIRTSTGWLFSDNLAHKCCKNAAIRSNARKTYNYRKPGHENVHFKNEVAGKWNAKEPLQIVVSDMTVLKHRGKNYEWTYIYWIHLITLLFQVIFLDALEMLELTMIVLMI